MEKSQRGEGRSPDPTPLKDQRANLAHVTFGGGSPIPNIPPVASKPGDNRIPYNLEGISIDPKVPMYSVEIDFDSWSERIKSASSYTDMDIRPKVIPLVNLAKVLNLKGRLNVHGNFIIEIDHESLFRSTSNSEALITAFHELKNRINLQIAREGIDLAITTDYRSLSIVLPNQTSDSLENIKVELTKVIRAYQIMLEFSCKSLAVEPERTNIIIRKPALEKVVNANTPTPQITAMTDDLEVKDLKRSLADMGGNPELKEEIGKLITMFKELQFFKERALQPPRGILLEGPPGTGKTLAAEIIASEVGRRFYKITGPDFLTAYYGESEKKLATILLSLKKPCILFLDEIDSIGESRDRLSEPSRRVLTTLLQHMDGIGDDDGILFIAATNRKDALDPALLRTGRFDRHIHVGYPDAAAIKQIFSIHIDQINKLTHHKIFSDEVNLDLIVNECNGLVGAEVKEIIRRCHARVVFECLADKKEHLVTNDILFSEIVKFKQEREKLKQLTSSSFED